MTDHCPICKGQGKTLDPVPPDFPKHSHWEFRDKENLCGVILVCDGCNGSGLYPDYCARVLGGEFPTHQLTVEIIYQPLVCDPDILRDDPNNTFTVLPKT